MADVHSLVPVLARAWQQRECTALHHDFQPEGRAAVQGYRAGILIFHVFGDGLL